MKEMLEMLVKSLVDNKDNVEITEKENGDDITLELRVDPSDMGKVIGKQGKIAKAIRVLMRAYATKVGKKVNVEILD
ncbi:MAG: KH domain-containing protein [Clostridia bacterium]|nr:KH domain-containing protein [Clostridia bacterium]